MTTTLVQISDPHVREEDERPALALARAVAQVNRLRPAPVAVVVTGDLANGPSHAEYARVRVELDKLDAPVHVLPGNHDDRDGLRETFGLQDTNYAVQAGPLRLVCCDTLVPGEDGGSLDVERLAALVAQEPDAPTIVAMHHHPVPIGVPALDDIGLPREQTAVLAALLAASPSLLRVACGHVHRSSAATLGATTVVSAPSTNLQTALDFTSDDFAIDDAEPAGFVIHALVASALVSHTQAVL